MFPVMQSAKARTIAAFGPMLRHDGEELSLVVIGRVQVIINL